MNFHLLRGDREAGYRWFNPLALSLGGNSLVLIKDPRSHIISCFSLHEDEKSLLFVCFSQCVYLKIIRMNEIPSSCPNPNPKHPSR